MRWFETRSAADLEGTLVGLACPVVVIDLDRHQTAGLEAVGLIHLRAPDARSLVLDPEAHHAGSGLARELGATHVVSGFVPPPVIAELLARWIALARRSLEQAGWSRTMFPPSETDPWSWLSQYLGQPEGPPRPDRAGRPGGSSTTMTSLGLSRLTPGGQAVQPEIRSPRFPA